LVLCACQNGLGWPRFGIVASKRIGNAVVRNRVRRLISEAVRVQCDLVRPGWDVVLIARRGILGADYWAVEGSVTQLLGTAKLFDATLGKSSVALEEGQ
jgi:ribonuclease P protein component